MNNFYLENTYNVLYGFRPLFKIQSSHTQYLINIYYKDTPQTNKNSELEYYPNGTPLYVEGERKLLQNTVCIVGVNADYPYSWDSSITLESQLSIDDFEIYCDDVRINNNKNLFALVNIDGQICFCTRLPDPFAAYDVHDLSSLFSPRCNDGITSTFEYFPSSANYIQIDDYQYKYAKYYKPNYNQVDFNTIRSYTWNNSSDDKYCIIRIKKTSEENLRGLINIHNYGNMYDEQYDIILSVQASNHIFYCNTPHQVYCTAYTYEVNEIVYYDIVMPKRGWNSTIITISSDFDPSMCQIEIINEAYTAENKQEMTIENTFFSSRMISLREMSSTYTLPIITDKNNGFYKIAWDDFKNSLIQKSWALIE